jgi:hypothetical protein
MLAQKKDLEFLRAAVIRAIRTGCQTILSMVTVGQTVMDVDWRAVIGVTLVAMLISFLTAILTGLPEVSSQGAFLIDDSDPEVTKWTLAYNGDPEQLKAGDRLSFVVKNKEDENESIHDANSVG